MSFSVRILGSAAMFATAERAASGFLIEVDGRHLWLDAGPGTWRNLLQHIEYAQLEGVILTHRHPDHTTDVFQAHHALQHGQREPLPSVPLWAPAETIEACCAFVPEFSQSFDLHEVSDGEAIDFAEAKISFFGMAHPPETLGVRIEHEGAVFSYSSDSGPEADFDGLARDADLFICEATYQGNDEDWSGHLNAETAATIATRCGVKRLVLTHLQGKRDLGIGLVEADKASSGLKVELADDGKRYEVKR
ncbi:MAG: MBL fold metallo-hydrolase [Actinomycetota bacterium]